jgi:hypothetical protein
MGGGLLKGYRSALQAKSFLRHRAQTPRHAGRPGAHAIDPMNCDCSRVWFASGEWSNCRGSSQILLGLLNDPRQTW